MLNFSLIFIFLVAPPMEFSWKNNNLISNNSNLTIEKDKKLGKVLKISNKEQKKSIKIFKLLNPNIKSTIYTISGWVKYENTAANSYLEMMSWFPGNRHYFSRTLGGSGPMASISGSSKWRRFALPFSTAGSSDNPIKLEVTAVFMGKGDIWLSSLKLSHGGISNLDNSSEIAKKKEKAWWGEKTGGWIGGIWGGFIGIFGALAGIFISKKIAKTYVKIFSIILTLVGLTGSAVAGFAYFKHQPYAVYYPLLLAGAISILFGVFLLHGIFSKEGKY